MSLTDRLHAAARARDGRPDPTPAAPPSLLEEVPVGPPPIRIVAAASTPVPVVTPDPTAEPDSVCPTCGRTGELGVVDLPYRTADWSCAACGTLWQATLAPPDDA